MTASGPSGQWTGVYSVNLPAGWAVISCVAVYNGQASPCTQRDAYWDQFLNDFIKAGNWYSLQSPPMDVAEGETVEVVWKLLPKAAGFFTLDYYAVLFNGFWYNDGILDDTPFGHDITISEMIPTLTGNGVIVLIGLMLLAGTAAIILRKKRWGRSFRSIFLVLLLVSIAAPMLQPAAPVEAQQRSEFRFDPMAVTMENLLIFKEMLDNDGDLAKLALEDPKTVIKRYFDLNVDQKAFLDALTAEELQAAMQVLVDAENVDSMRCWVKNTDPPQLKCWIVEASSAK